jgi:hypothetical protein
MCKTPGEDGHRPGNCLSQERPGLDPSLAPAEGAGSHPHLELGLLPTEVQAAKLLL